MNLSEAIEIVIKDEIELQEKYTKLAEKQTDPLLKAFFDRIVIDAQNHERKLRKKYAKLLHTLKKRMF